MTQLLSHTWPQGRKCAVSISVLFNDGMDAADQAPDLLDRVKSFSVWQYGAARGVERLCRSFADHGIRTDWFVPGSVATRHEALVRAVADAGHRIESHGWAFEHYDRLAPDTALDLLVRSRETLSAIADQEVSGFRLPAGNWPRHFDRLLLQAGYGWSASLNGDDVPYLHPSSLVEIPVHIELDDRPYFQFNFTPAFPKGQSRLPSYKAVLENWKAEFDAYRRFGLCYVLQLHPEWSGTPGRIAIIDGLLRHIAAHDDVWFANGAEIAAWHAANGTAPPPEHPINVYESYVQEQHP